MPRANLDVTSYEAQTRLTNLVIAKSIVEGLFVAAIAVGFYFSAFNPFFRGWTDEANANHVSGWVVNEATPFGRVETQLYVDGQFAGSLLANLPRPDVLAAGRACNEGCGFRFDTPPLVAGEHEARAYAVHASGGGLRRTLQLIGRPLRFTVK